MKSTIICAALAAVFVHVAAGEEESGPRGFSVDFFACTESVGVGPVDFARASTLVPSSFTILTVGAAAAIVVRATNCASATMNNGTRGADDRFANRDRNRAAGQNGEH